MAKFCVNCGTPLPDGAGFCPKCGAKVEIPHCPSCGKEVDFETEYCIYCGARLKEEAVPEPLVPETPNRQDEKKAPAQPEEVPQQGEPVPHLKAQGFSQDNTKRTASKATLEQIVEKNTAYYLPQFEQIESGQKGKFNWAAFFLGGFFCFYRRSGKIFWKYCKWAFILMAVILVGTVASAGLAINSVDGIMTWAIVCGVAGLVTGVVGIVCAVRCGKNFNQEYYSLCVARADDPNYPAKKRGVSVGGAILFWLVLSVCSALAYAGISAVLLQSLFGGLPSDPWDLDDPDSGYEQYTPSSTPTSEIKEPTNDDSFSWEPENIGEEINTSRLYEISDPWEAELTPDDFVGTWETDGGIIFYIGNTSGNYTIDLTESGLGLLGGSFNQYLYNIEDQFCGMSGTYGGTSFSISYGYGTDESTSTWLELVVVNSDGTEIRDYVSLYPSKGYDLSELLGDWVDTVYEKPAPAFLNISVDDTDQGVYVTYTVPMTDELHGRLKMDEDGDLYVDMVSIYGDTNNPSFRLYLFYDGTGISCLQNYINGEQSVPYFERF